MGQKRLSGGQLKLNNFLSLDRVAIVAWKGGIDRRECEFCIDVFTDVFTILQRFISGRVVKATVSHQLKGISL